MAEAARKQNRPTQSQGLNEPANDNRKLHAANDNKQTASDEKRRIQNIALVTNEQKTTSTEGVMEDFDAKSLQGRVRKNRSLEQKELQRLKKEIDAAEGDERTQLQREERFMRRQLSKASRQVNVQQGKIVRKKGLSTFGKGLGLTFAFNAWLWSALFSLIAASAYMAQSVVEVIKSDTLVGWFVGLFIDFEKYMPSYLIGGAFAALSSFLALIAVLVFTAWFKLMGLSTGKSLFAKFSSYVLIAVAILPFINIFPALLIWVAWASLSSLSRKK